MNMSPRQAVIHVEIYLTFWATSLLFLIPPPGGAVAHQLLYWSTTLFTQYRTASQWLRHGSTTSFHEQHLLLLILQLKLLYCMFRRYTKGTGQQKYGKAEVYHERIGRRQASYVPENLNIIPRTQQNVY